MSPASPDGRSREDLLLDAFGRRAQTLRLSVTDRCNFRCSYCMPHEDMEWFPRGKILSFEEMRRLAALLVPLGITRILNHRHEDPERARIQDPPDDPRLVPGNAYDRRHAMQVRSSNHFECAFEVHAAVLYIDQNPVESERTD